MIHWWAEAAPSAYFSVLVLKGMKRMSQFRCANIEALAVCMCTCVGVVCVYTVEVSKILLHPICFLVRETFLFCRKSWKVTDANRNALQVDPAPVYVLSIAALEAAQALVPSVPATAAFWISTRSS